MIYKLAHIMQEKTPWVWNLVEELNAALCAFKIGDRRRLQTCMIEGVRVADIKDAEPLACFFASQPPESYKWFRPHAFDAATMRKLLRRKSYIIYVMEERGEIIGYAFLRCFINGKCFLGKMVDARHQGKGVCTKLCAVGMDIAVKTNFRMYESINKENIGSMKASQKACEVIVVEELENGDLLIEDHPKVGDSKRK